MLAPSRHRAGGWEGRRTRQTHPDDHRLLALEFGDEFVPPEDLRLVEGPEPAHHFDAALGGIRHLGGGRRAGAGLRERTLPPGRCRRRPCLPPTGRGEAGRGEEPFSGRAPRFAPPPPPLPRRGCAGREKGREERRAAGSPRPLSGRGGRASARRLPGGVVRAPGNGR